MGKPRSVGSAPPRARKNPCGWRNDASNAHFPPAAAPGLPFPSRHEDALPPGRYRLVRITGQYLPPENSGAADDAVHLEPPTPEKLFQQIWEKQGYAADADVLSDFMSLVHDAQKSLESEPQP